MNAKRQAAVLFSATDIQYIEPEEEVWTRGVDRFSQHVKKFESKAVLPQTSALSEL